MDLLSTNSSGFPSTEITKGNVTVSAAGIMSPAMAAFFTFVGISTIAIGIVGNLAILVAFLVVPRLRTHNNYFLASLALSDLILAAFHLPLEVEYHTRSTFTHSVTICDFMYTLFFLTFTSSALNLFAMSAYRYLTISMPFRANSVNRTHIVGVILAIWLYSTLVSFLPLMGWRPAPSIATGKDCFYSFARAYAIFVLTVNLLVPAFIGCIFYGLIFQIAKVQANKIARNQVLDAAERRRGHLFKGAKTLSKIAVVYMICWFPYVTEVLLVLTSVIKSNQVIHYFFVYLCYANSAINPFLYAGLCGDFKEVFGAFAVQCRSSLSNCVRNVLGVPDRDLSVSQSNSRSRRQTLYSSAPPSPKDGVETNV